MLLLTALDIQGLIEEHAADLKWKGAYYKRSMLPLISPKLQRYHSMVHNKCSDSMS